MMASSKSPVKVAGSPPPKTTMATVAEDRRVVREGVSDAVAVGQCRSAEIDIAAELVDDFDELVLLGAAGAIAIGVTVHAAIGIGWIGMDLVDDQHRAFAFVWNAVAIGVDGCSIGDVAVVGRAVSVAVWIAIVGDPVAVAVQTVPLLISHSSGTPLRLQSVSQTSGMLLLLQSSPRSQASPSPSSSQSA